MTRFIAEISSNHHQDLQRALKFIDAASAAGCSGVKFQLFRVEELFAPEILQKSPKHRERKKWELPTDHLPWLAQRCRDKHLEFGCTPFYLEAVDELRPYVDFYKVASYELLWDDLLAACARTRKRVLLSTGMATLPEIQHAVEVLRMNGCTHPLLFHCTSAYPTPHEEANLSAIETIRLATGCEVGWSDHTVEPAVISRAVNRWGVTTVEFHFDLDGEGEEFPAGHCWLPEKITTLISDIRKGLAADGTGIKEPVPSELPDREWRADPSDGLRPLRSIRHTWQP